MFLRQAPSSDDSIVHVDYSYENKIGTVEYLLYQRPDGTMYEMISTYKSVEYREVIADQLSEVRKLKYLRENREEILRQGNALDFAMLVDQLEQTIKTKRGK